MRAPYVASKYSEALLKRIADNLNPSNMLLFVVSPDAPTKNFSMFYHTPYQSHTLDEDYVKAIESGDSVFDLYLPEANFFIPSALDLMESPSYSKPQIYTDKPGLKVWYLPNTEFGTPKAQLFVALKSDKVADLERLSSLKLYIAYISDLLNDALYPALLAGLNYDISASERGLTINIGGYSEKQEILLKEILSVLTNPVWDLQRFKLVKQQQIRQKNNTKRDYPFRQIISYLYSIIEGKWMPVDQANTIASIDMKNLEQFSLEFLRSLEVDMLATGNQYKESLDSMIKQLDPLKYRDLTNYRKVAKLAEKDFSRSMAIDHNDTVLIQYIQADSDSIEERAVTALIAQMISAPFYNEIRTQKQLGYVVSAFSLPINNVPGLCMIAQSPVATEQSLKEEFSAFNQGFTVELDNLSPEELQMHKRALLVEIEKAPDNLSELSGRHLTSLNLGFDRFDFYPQLADAISALTVADVRSAYDRLVIDKPRRLWVQTKNNASVHADQAGSGTIDQYFIYPY